ncbi:DEAD/DEAH box helicase [Garciella nitratireducens]|uniref:DEAD/DEAH box helicase n=1 Tax=Garciella nitratireducens TaxID=218205 RepID=UPI000DEB95F9|nr:DEAD/DEAH box helicase [Garciella nitratireducens]RBP46800.1 ATP-dependent RNA helicase DeaD [Garciella nitratireducens]
MNDRNSFEDLNLSDEVKRAIKDMGFEEATPIQLNSIPSILKGKDVIGQAQTGTGKTAAFGIPILEKVNPKDKFLQALVLCPTRELAIQVSEEINKLGKYVSEVKTLPIYGGQSIERQIKALKKGVQIVIGTPGRIIDHMKRKTLRLENLKMIVLDEADEMLNMGFREDIETILKDTSEERQTILFSATMPQEILEIAQIYQKDPKLIKVVRKKLTVPSIEQYYLEVKQSNKFEILTRLIDIYNPKLALVFCNTKKKVDEIVDLLKGRGYFADGLHGDMKQRQRDQVMERFRNGNVDILVATDVAARGIDVNDVDIVFNYDVPQDEEYYVHRIGRTGRAGRSGKAFTFVVGREIYKLKDIQRYTNTKIKLQKVPTFQDVAEVKISMFLEEVKNIIEKNSIGKEREILDKLLQEDYTAIDIAVALLKIIMKNEEKKEAIDEDFGSNKKGIESGMVRFFINVGKNQKIRPKDIVGAIAGETGVPGNLIGAIDIYEKFSFVEVPKEYAKKVLQGMKKSRIKGKSVNIEKAKRRE